MRAACISLPRALVVARSGPANEQFWVTNFWHSDFWVAGFWVT